MSEENIGDSFAVCQAGRCWQRHAAPMNAYSFACALALAAANVAVAQSSQQPLPAVPSYPSGTIVGKPGKTLVFTWSHVMPVPPRPPAPNPTPRYFMICLVDPAVHTCASTPTRWWIDEHLYRTSEIRQGVPLQIAGYNYRFAPVQLTSDQFDRPMQWTVRACRSKTLSSCSVTPALDVWWLSRNFHATNVTDLSTSDWVNVSGEVENLSATESGTFTSMLIAIHAVWNAASESCETNVNLPGVDRAVTNRGVVLSLPGLPRIGTQIDVGDHTVVAVYSSSSAEVQIRTASYSGIPPGATGQPVSLITANATTPAAWATILLADVHDQVVETDETDNRYGDCHKIF